jgi:hypothetical protein
VFINRTDHDLSISLEELDLLNVEAMRLIAPSNDSVGGITFAGEEVGDDGSWAAKHVEQVDGQYLIVSRMSAVVVINKRFPI